MLSPFTVNESLGSMATQRIHPLVQQNRSRFIEAVRSMDQERHVKWTYYENGNPYETGVYVLQPHTPGCMMCVNGVALIGLGLDNRYEMADGCDPMCDALGVDPQFFTRVDDMNFREGSSFAQMADWVSENIDRYTDWESATVDPVYLFEASRLT